MSTQTLRYSYPETHLSGYLVYHTIGHAPKTKYIRTRADVASNKSSSSSSFGTGRREMRRGKREIVEDQVDDISNNSICVCGLSSSVDRLTDTIRTNYSTVLQADNYTRQDSSNSLEENQQLRRSRRSWKNKLWRLFCVRTEEMGHNHTKSISSHTQPSTASTNRSNAAPSPTFAELHIPNLHGHRTASGTKSGSTRRKPSRTLQSTNKLERLPQNLEGLVVIEQLNVFIDEKPTKIDEESPAVLKYRTPHFRASAAVRIPAIPSNETWQIGWIQACTDMVFMNTYGSYGVSSWEFPELKKGGFSMISDSDGRNYPWYGSRTEVVTVVGPTKSDQLVQVSMNDNFYPHITWSVPLRNHRDPALTHVRRSQGFYTWLVAKNLDTAEVYILKTIRWSMHLEIMVDPRKSLGQRARLVGSGIQAQPQVLNYNVEIPRCALEPPNANSAQTLIWYPNVGTPQVIVPSKWKTTDRAKEE